MDEDDSQDELINKNTSHSKGKRAAVWAISDDSDDVEEESEEGDSDSGEGEEEDHLDGEEDDDDDEEEEEEGDDSDDEEEEDGKALEGAAGGTSADLAGMSSDDETEKCPICLNSFSSQPVATPESCQHYFCLDCILEWSKNANSCPVDRIVFSNIYLRKCFGGKVQKMITVQKPVKEGQEDVVDLELEQTTCEVCGGSDREDRLLLCDGCDAGYHMECLTPPLDAVPVEEWFCPECEANNRHSRGSVEELSETESLSASARPTTSRSRSSASGPTRAIARTQQSERVRANVNRHRITQARTAQLAPRYLMQSTWLDETINAVVAGLNTAVYIRDLTPRATSSRRRRTVKRRKGKSKKMSSGKGEKGKTASTGVRRRRRRARRTKSRKKLVVKKQATTRGRIARSLGIAKPKKGSSLPTVYRPSEHTLGNMRADIGAASLSVYGDPFDLDPFVDGEEEEEEQQTRVTSLLEAKRRGISHSALRSHQPVARPITAGLSRRGVGVSQAGGVVEAAPVPDLLGSILSGQSMLLMDSSDVVINRDGSLKANKSVSLSPALKPGSSSGETSSQINPGMSPNPGASSLSLYPNGDLPGSSCSPLSRPSSSHSSPCLSPFAPSSPSPSQAGYNSHPSPHSHPPPLDHPRLQPPNPRRPSLSPGLRGTNGVGTQYESLRGTTSSSTLPTPDSRARSKDTAPPQSQPRKAPTKPVWVDVSVLPRIPKIKRESGGNDATSQNGSSSNSRGSTITAVARGGGGGGSNGMPGTDMHSLAGDKGRHQSVDQQRGRAEGQAQRHRPDRAGPSSSFSNSFSTSSSSSSSSGSPANHPGFFSSSSTSSSSTVSFRINSSGNSWHARRLSNASSAATTAPAAGGSAQESWGAKEEEARRRQQRRDKQILLASRTLVKKEQEDSDIYDPFNPTLSDSNSSDSDAESQGLDSDSQRAAAEGKPPGLGSEEGLGRSKPSLVQGKAETLESKITQEEPTRVKAQENASHGDRGSVEHMKVKVEPGSVEANFENQEVIADTNVKKEPELADAKLETIDATTPLPYSPLPVKTERTHPWEESVQDVQPPNSIPPIHKTDPSTSSSGSNKKKQKTEIKSEHRDSPDRSRSPAKVSGHGKKTSKGGGAPEERRSSSCSSEAGRRRGDQHVSGQGGRRRGVDKDRERSSRRSRSRERRRARSTSESSQSDSSDGSRRKRRRSRSKDRRRSRSASTSSSRERSRRKKHKRGSRERNDGRGSDRDRGQASKDKRRSRSRSRSQSRSRSRSRERRKDHTRSQPSSSSSRDRVESRSKDKKRPRSRSRSKERRKEEGSSKNSQRASGSSSLSAKEPKELKGSKKGKDLSQSTLKDNKDARKKISVSDDKKEEKTSVSDDKKEDKTSVSEVKKELKTSVSEDKKDEKNSFPEVKKEEKTSFSEVKKETKDLGTDRQFPTAKSVKESGLLKEIKKENVPSVDMFEDSTSSKPVKKEEIEVELTSPGVVHEEKDIKKELTPIKSEKDIKKEPTPVKSEKDVKKEPTPVKSEKDVKKEPTPVKSEKDVKKEPTPVKSETCDLFSSAPSETVKIKSEPSSPDSRHRFPPGVPPPQPSPSIPTPVPEDPAAPHPPPASMAPAENQSTVLTTAPAKQGSEQPSDSDEDFNVDMMLDNIDFVKSEKVEGSGPTVKREKEGDEVKNEGEQVSVLVKAKSKAPVKRVTWNIQEPEGPQPEKSASKLALYKLKLKQEGARRPSSSIQTPSQEIPGTLFNNPSKRGNITAGPLSTTSAGLLPEGTSDTGQAEAGEAEEGDVSRKDKVKLMYLKKLHMQERAIEEVKLAIKPFYQRRDITKDEYKEILRKAVQKVCHSKSGEINPVKVANLVKAYVDRYKHTRKQKKGEDGGKTEELQTEGTKNSESP
ncbi:uncharacterized protein phrf1 [Polymixia lowei]